MYLNMETMNPNARYHLLTQSVIPRPIAWVLTDNGIEDIDNKYNLAPFSFFNVVSASPPLLVIGINKQKTNGETKDTLHNLIERKMATIHIVDSNNIQPMVDSSVELKHGESEIIRDNNKITLCNNENYLPHIKESKIAFFCELDHIHEVDGGMTSIVFCKINETYIADEAITTNNDNIIIDPLKIEPISRLGLSNYHKLDTTISIKRPVK